MARKKPTMEWNKKDKTFSKIAVVCKTVYDVGGFSTNQSISSYKFLSLKTSYCPIPSSAFIDFPMFIISVFLNHKLGKNWKKGFHYTRTSLYSAYLLYHILFEPCISFMICRYENNENPPFTKYVRKKYNQNEWKCKKTDYSPLVDDVGDPGSILWSIVNWWLKFDFTPGSTQPWMVGSRRGESG
jgi:hypothetical protein